MRPSLVRSLFLGFLFAGLSLHMVPARGEDAKGDPVPAGSSTGLSADSSPGSEVLTAGATVQVTGKYAELVDHELRLVESSTMFLVTKQDLLNKLLGLRSQKDNLKVAGTVVTTPRGMAVDVSSIELAASDLEVFQGELTKALGEAKEERARLLVALLDRVAENCEKYKDPEVQEFARKVAIESLDAEDGRLDPKDFAARLKRVREVHALLRSPQLTYDLLLSLDKKFPGRTEVRDFFRELNCRRHGGKWVTYEQFKQLEGFILFEGKWVSHHEKDLLETIRVFNLTNPTNLILRGRTERQYKLLAEKGSVEEGMKPDEVYLALGAPDRVERRVLAQKEFDQWIYGEKCYYFLGGLLVKKPAK